MIGHPLRDALLVCPSAVSSAHGSPSIYPVGDFAKYTVKYLMRQID
jgi:hypothetical protein